MIVASSGPSTEPSPPTSLNGARVLVVEDEFLLAFQLEELLRSLGCTVLGPFSQLEDGLAAIQQGSFDVAILDINLRGTLVYPLADALTARGVPFVFLSGYTASNLPERFRARPRLSKPCDPEQLIKAVQSLL